MSDIKELLQKVANGEITPEEAELKLKMQPFEDLGYAKPDCHRALRQGAAEVIYGAGKTAEQIIGISRSLTEHGQKMILITRLDAEKAAAVNAEIPLDYRAEARIGIIGGMPESKTGKIVIATGGTSDIPVAEEAAVTAEAFGNCVTRLYDVGVAGIHRLLAYSEDIMTARVIIAVAGMEGALASVIGGMADCPVIAVPTSVGYGAAFGGLTALLAMLNSCASGVSVVNIDNGFGAGYLASMINKM
ncbi:MAG: nickel pincer cofactor biosynthesis protein LarB [Firmicutes bacterium]|nr:nickel pincer cofactor biosynthesis protein LarB [Bacillota bacterium]